MVIAKKAINDGRFLSEPATPHHLVRTAEFNYAERKICAGVLKRSLL
jgi:hypothetical protein